MSEASSGNVQWNDWFLDFGVFSTQGLSLYNGFFRGQRMFHKLNLPVIRVKYTKDGYLPGGGSVFGEGCGPYNDQISWDLPDFEDVGETLLSGPHHLVEVPSCSVGDRYLCVEEISAQLRTGGSEPRLKISVYARIGAYHIRQWWELNNNGEIFPRIMSKGLSCNLTHWHHPYWRFDFALGSPEVHRVSVHHVNGAKIQDIPNETKLLNEPFGREIEYRITSTQPPDIGFIEKPALAAIRPPELNDTLGIVGPTDFSNLDGYVRKFRPEEDRDWPHERDEDLAFAVDEPCDDTDIVFWSVCHLIHHAHEGEDHEHTVGPDLRFEPMILANLPPESFRMVQVSGAMHVKDFGVFDDNFNDIGFSEQCFVNPNVRAQQVNKKLVEGDVTAELIIRIEWQLDLSVKVNVVGNLFDELERVARVEGNFNVPRDTMSTGATVHLVDYHSGDPDTADMEITVENRQQ